MEKQGDDYLQAWRALGTILRDGGSWSGHEKNCCFLNTQAETFADVSTLVGLDHDGDSRAVALVDWDQDGDLDLWYSNRTAPRVQFMQNDTSQQGTSGFLSVRLLGKSCNRDAIGTRLELEMSHEGTTHKSIQTLRAGEGYLAQSSKWIHFGLGESSPVKLHIRWPNGKEQTLSELKTNSRYVVTEGEAATRIPESRSVVFPEMAEFAVPASDDIRVVSSRRIPMPELQLVDKNGTVSPFAANAGDYTLLTVWATWCQPCVAELQELHRHARELTDAKIRWLPLNVDELKSDDVAERWQLAAKLLNKIGVRNRGALATQAAVESLDVVQQVLVTKKDPLPVPCSFLVDGQGNLMVVYKGAVSAETVIQDISHLDQLTADPRDAAVPFPGLWAMNAFPPDLMAIPSGLRAIGRTTEALNYMLAHVPTRNFQPPITAAEIVEAYMSLGRDFVDKNRHDEAERALLQALKITPQTTQARLALGEIYLVKKRVVDAVTQYRAILRHVPDQPMSLNNLAWILATSKDGAVRSPAEAVTFAERLCERTNYGEPVSLDTLAVALAADGQFTKAVETIKKAIVIGRRVKKSTARMEARLKLFEAGHAYSE